MKTLIVALALTIGATSSAFARGEVADRGIPASLQNLEIGQTVNLSGNNSAYGFTGKSSSAATQNVGDIKAAGVAVSLR